MRVFVTGGTGLVGSHVIEQLRGQGHEITALVRKSSDTRHLREHGVALSVGDVGDVESLRSGMAQARAEAVVHAAAVVVESSDWSHYEEVGVKGTHNVLAAMKAAGVQRLVHISSTAVYGMTRTFPIPVTEGEPMASRIPSWNNYVREKVETEQAVWRAHERREVLATTLRPAVVLGLRDRNCVPGILRNLSAPRPMMLGKGGNRVPHVVVQDVASAVVSALERPVSVGNVYNLACAQSRTQAELYQLFADAAGLPMPQARTPWVMAAAISIVGNWLHGVLKRPDPLPFAPEGVLIWGTDTVVDSSKAIRDLGWSSNADLAQAVRQSVAWHLSQHPPQVVPGVGVQAGA